jgi:hypothetical protein
MHCKPLDCLTIDLHGLAAYGAKNHNKLFTTTNVHASSRPNNQTAQFEHVALSFELLQEGNALFTV